jgi:DNA-binding phage protein
MAAAKGPIERAIKRAIAARKETRYVTAKEAGVNYATLFRFLDDDADIRLSTVEALAEYLGLELKPKSKKG